MESDKAILREIVDDLYTGRLIKLSQMVEDGRISEGNARHGVFPELRAWRNRMERKVQGL